MRIIQTRLCTLLLLGLGLAGLQAQEAVPVTGGEATGNGGTVSYTIGQVSYTTMAGINGSVTEGVQQPYEIFTVSGVNVASGLTLNCIIYPNPSSDFIQLKVDRKNLEGLSCKLYNMQGKILKTINIVQSETNISMKELGASTYYLKITDGQNEWKVFKIIKH